MKKLIAAIATATAFAASTAFATLPYTPSPAVNISGNLTYSIFGDNITNNGTVTKSILKTVSFNNSTLLKLLNKSATVTNSMNHVAHANQIPAGSYIVWYMDDDSLIITNKDGFSFPLEGTDPVTTGHYDYGYLDYEEDIIVGNSSFKNSTGVGNEQDLASIYFYFYDSNGDVIECYGQGAYNWTWGTGSSSGQKASVSVNLQPSAYWAEADGNLGVTKGMNITGSGSATIYGFTWEYGEPFWYYEY